MLHLKKSGTPAMHDKTVLITGATDGIGKQTALDLAKMGAHVLIHGRDAQRTRNTLEQIRSAAGNDQLNAYVADFASLKQVRGMAAEICQKHDRLHVLLNNAGLFENTRRYSEDGFEMTFAVNHLAPFLLTLLLLEPLKASAPSRIVNVASMIHSGSIDFDNLQGEKNYSGNGAYCLSKLCNILFTYELAERLRGSGVTVNCLQPGVIGTKLFRAGWGGGGGGSVKEGSKNLVYVAADPELETVTGKYFSNRRETRSKAVTYEPEARKTLWRMSEEMVGFSLA